MRGDTMKRYSMHIVFLNFINLNTGVFETT